MTKQEFFDQYGCVNVKSLVDQELISIISQYLENKIKRGEWTEGNEGPFAVSKYFYYAEPLMEVMLTKFKPSIEEAIGKSLFPTYSYARIYQPGEELEPHTDRNECEISVTVNVASKGPPSFIWMKYKDNDPIKYDLNPGDAVIYKGCEALHWRAPLEQDQLNVQFMLHYVDKNGPNAHLIRDGRPSFALPYSSRRV